MPTPHTPLLAALAAQIGPVPRYTSYPTAPHFQAVDNDRAWRAWLGDLPDESAFNLYVHVPFCRQMCWYCGCHTQVVKNDDTLERFLALLLREIDQTLPYLPSRPRLTGLHFGGGTPSILGGDGLQRVAEKLYRHFTPEPGAEIAIELDPRRFEAELIPGLKALGINRTSLGVQSLDESVQAAINRRQPLDMVARTVDMLREAGIESLNLDLIYGLPRQTVENVVGTVQQSLMLKPDRVALFGYAHVPWMKAHQARIDTASLPDTAARFAQEAAAAQVLVENGFCRVGLDHFARPDDRLAQHAVNGELHRNFQGYTTAVGEVLLGFGPSAISTLPQGYAQNVASVASWRQAVHNGDLPVARMRALSQEDILRRAVIEELMCHLNVDLATMATRHGLRPDLFDADLPRLELLERQGVVERHGYRVVINEAARPLARQVCAAFDSYLHRQSAAAPPRHAAA
ncbi:MAG: oxygen-independent coproporphyrinogen III oxidase [Ferrovibrio sp.]|uniref:oxygen-independent coproporphyrinogen III oxidase n=1 Tax=Ferrovibrio sp. TaxID=1917215 RepID=UPI00391B21B6